MYNVFVVKRGGCLCLKRLHAARDGRLEPTYEELLVQVFSPGGWLIAGVGTECGLETINHDRADKPKLGDKAKRYLKRHNCGNPNCYSGTTGKLRCERGKRSGKRNLESGQPDAKKLCRGDAPLCSPTETPGGSSNKSSVREALSSSCGAGSSKVGPGGKHKNKTKHLGQTR